MSQNRRINIEKEDEELSLEFWDGFNGQLTRQMSGLELFSEQGSELTGSNQEQGQSINNPVQQVEDMLSLTQAGQENLPQLEPTPDHADHTPAESEEFDHGNRKNICGYVLKKAIQVFYRASSRSLLEKECQKQGTTYSDVIGHFRSSLPKFLGVAALTAALTPKTDSQFRLKEVFRKFLLWFLRKRYMLSLLTAGKMADKSSYIEAKNRQLLYFQYELAKTLLSMNSIND